MISTDYRSNAMLMAIHKKMSPSVSNLKRTSAAATAEATCALKRNGLDTCGSGFPCLAFRTLRWNAKRRVPRNQAGRQRRKQVIVKQDTLPAALQASIHHM
jgi:hypothetical protein